MALEYRNGRSYYYKCRREGGKVINEYVASGDEALHAAEQDRKQRQELNTRREKLEDVQQELIAARGPLLELVAETDLLISSALLDAGYHRPYRGPWRKKRK